MVDIDPDLEIFRIKMSVYKPLLEGQEKKIYPNYLLKAPCL